MWSTCLPTIHGSYTEIPSSLTRAGCPCPEFFMAAPQSFSEVDLESVSSEVLGGVGTTGIMIGTVTARLTTTTPISPTAARSSTATISITTLSIAMAAISTTATHSTEADPEAEIQDSMVAHLH